MSNKWFRWLVPQLFFCMNLAGVVVYAVTSTNLSSTLNFSAAQVAGLGGAYFISYALSQLILGASLGALPAKYLLAITALISAAGAFLMSGAQNYEIAMLARVLMGIGFGTAMVGVIYVVGQLFNDRFAFMVNLSQGTASAVGATIGSLASIPILQSFRIPFLITGIVLVVNSILLLIFIKDDDSKNAPSDRSQTLSLTTQIRTIASNSQFWIGAIYFTGLFGTFLAYADLWNIKFQMDVFNQTTVEAAMMNSGAVWGCTLGTLITGIWANRVGFWIPARVCSWLSLIVMGILYTQPLPSLAVPLMIALGLCVGAAPLGLAAMNAHVSEKVKSLSSAMLLTIVFMGGGLLMANIGAALAPLPVNEFATYRAGMNWFLVPIAIAAVASLMMKPGRASA